MPTVDIWNGRIGIISEWSEKDMITQIPGARWDKDERIWSVPLTWAACIQLRGIFGKDLVVCDDLRQWAKEEREDRVDEAMKRRDVKDLSADGFLDDSLWSKLYGFQRAGAVFLRTAGSALLTDEMGTGKTIQTLTALSMHCMGTSPALVICPNSMTGTWANEASIWYPQATPYVVRGTAVKKRKILAEAAKDPSALVVINFEAVRLHSRTSGFGSIALARCVECGGSKDTKVTAAKCEAHPRELDAIPFRMVVVDEAHRIKDGKAKQTRAVWAVGDNPSVERRIALTGTPVANNASDLWAVMRFVAPEEYPTKSKFVDRYCHVIYNTWGGMEIGGLNPKTKDELFKFLNPRMRRMLKSEVLTQLPEKVFSTRFVDMSPAQDKSYTQMENSLAARLPDGTLMMAKDDLSSRTRLLQFSSANMKHLGAHINSKGEEVQDYEMCEPSPKLDVMEEVLEELGDRPLVVAAVHKQLIDLAEARLIKAGIPYGKITGDVAQWERDIYVKKFQAGELRVMLLTMQAGGVGITLTKADTMLRLQCSWSMVDNKQVVDRIHRIGSEVHQQVNIIDLITMGTIEEDQVRKVQKKHLILKEITQDEEIV